jgi:Fe-Mn family superoxide dismutase
MGPGAGGEPTGILMDKIQKDFGSFTNFKDNFSKAGSTVFGSGWVWLIVKDNALQITTSPNQDNPLMDISPIQGKPILCMDVWEHAYYLHYQNRRTEYISAFWNVINWNQVSLNFQK